MGAVAGRDTPRTALSLPCCCAQDPPARAEEVTAGASEAAALPFQEAAGFGSALSEATDFGEAPGGATDLGALSEATDGANPFAGLGAADAVDAALQRARRLMEPACYDVLGAEEVLAQAAACLEAGDALVSRARTDTSGPEPRKERLAIEEHAARLRSADVFEEVKERIAQFDAAVDSLCGDDFETLYESEHGKLEIRQSKEGTWFEYRLTVDIDAPLAECLSTGQEMDLVHEAQPLVSSADFVGDGAAFNMKCIYRIPVAFIRAELLLEIVRYRDRRFGFLVEVARSDFCQDGVPVPPKRWGVVRPWVYNTNLWIPRGGGAPGTTIVQVNRVDCTLSLPSWVLSFLFRNMSTRFIRDLRASAAKSAEPGSPWARRIEDDERRLYSEARKVEDAADARPAARLGCLPGQWIFERDWRLRPELVDTRPPSSRKTGASTWS